MKVLVIFHWFFIAFGKRQQFGILGWPQKQAGTCVEQSQKTLQKVSLLTYWKFGAMSRIQKVLKNQSDIDKNDVWEVQI